MDLPAPKDVTERLNQASQLVTRLNEIAQRLGKTYGIHGTPATKDGLLFSITRLGEKWGIFVRETDEDKFEPLIGQRIEVKRAFLGLDIEGFFKSYLKQVVKVKEDMGNELAKAGESLKKIEEELKALIGEIK